MHYHTQHSPLGAFASFTCGLPGSGGGFGQALAGPASQNLHIGWRRPDQAWQLLPFYVESGAAADAAFLGEGAPHGFGPPPDRVALDPADYDRSLGWATDRFAHGPFAFTLHTPWDHTPRPDTLDREAARFAFAPVVCAVLEADNSDSDLPLELVFGLGDKTGPWRPLSDVRSDLVGFARGLDYGYATQASPEVSLHQGLEAWSGKYHDHRGLHLLGGESQLRFAVPPRSRRAYPIALGFHRAGPVTTGISASLYHATLFSDLEDVLAHGLAQHERYLALAARRDAELASAPLSSDQRWLVAQATHGYFGSTELLATADGEPLWVVNEGEYRMINTFDLTVDHLFFELSWFPWAVRDTLDLFADRYAYTDTLHASSAAGVAGGLSFTHDMGVADQFTPLGYSSYECADLRGCFSQMTAEQLVNWVCCACTYAEKTGDTAWLVRRAKTLAVCAESLRHRDHPNPSRRDGLMKWDSDRCGPDGSEITTYDSLDVSLGQARNNLYLAVKTFAAWHLLARAFVALNDVAAAANALADADRLATTLEGKHESETGLFPAVFENDNRSRLIPAVEGLIFPLYLGFADELRTRNSRLFEQFETHLRHCLVPGVCIDADSGAWKLSSTSHNTWFSKIALAQHVVRRLFPAALSPAADAADAVHARFQQSRPLGRYAMVDQVHSATGADLGSRYYPRVVTACLWLET
jgi:hypothetical protein